MNTGLFGLVSQQFYAYWTVGGYSCFTCLLPTMTVSVGFKDSFRLRWAPLSCIILPLTPLHRLFVVVQFVFVAFQCLMFVLLIPLSWHQVWSVDPFRLSACGVWRWRYCEFFFLLPSSSWRCNAHQSCSVVFPVQTIGTCLLYVIHTSSIVADTHSSAAIANVAWEAPTNSICQLFIKLMANIFLACRSVYILV